MRETRLIPVAYEKSVAGFLGSLGVNTHINWQNWWPGPYESSERTVEAIIQLGVASVRDMGVSLLVDEEAFERLATAGVSTSFVMSDNHDTFYTQLHRIGAFSERFPNGVRALEGANEIWLWPITYGGFTGVAGAQAMQATIYAFARAHPVLQHVDVYDFTDWTATGISDYGNVHLYSVIGGHPSELIRWGMNHVGGLLGGRDFVLTEIGWPTGDQVNINPHPVVPGLTETVRWASVDEVTQARLSLNAYAAGYSLGAVQTYLYELFDSNPLVEHTDIHWNFGLFRSDFTPKLAATAISRMTSFMKAPDTQLAVLNVRMDIRPMPRDVQIQALRGDGDTLQILVWRERDIWDEDLHRQIHNGADRVRLSVHEGSATATVFNPINGTRQDAAVHGLAHLDFRMSDDLLILRLDLAPSLARPGAEMRLDLAVIGMVVEAPNGDGAFLGGIGHDELIGTPGRHSFWGGAGDDVIRLAMSFGNAFGGEGNDTVVGGDGHDALLGEGGDDSVYGGAGDDWLDGGSGRDLLEGGRGTDNMRGGHGDDTLHGNDGADALLGGPGRDTLVGGDGRDWMAGGDGDDLLEGDSDDDTLCGEAGSDTLMGGAGDDAIDGGTGDDVIVGGAGRDWLVGGVGNDTLDGDAGADMLIAGAGDDMLYAGQGDIARGEAGNDVIHVRGGAAGIDAGPGDDRVIVHGDTLEPGSRFLILGGLGGQDTLVLMGLPAEYQLDLRAGGGVIYTATATLMVSGFETTIFG